jgi:hypothetical protein
MGAQWMLTGYQPTIEVNDNIYPACGSVVAKMRGPNEPGLPAYVNLPRNLSLGKAAYLGASYNPFAPDNDPNSPGFQVRNLKLPGRINADRLGRRRELLRDLDQIRRDIDARGDIAGLDTFYRDALEMVTDTRGLQNDVLVMAMGEFGRTPRINSGAGRDHWPGAMSILYAGGGLKMGQAIGTTNALAEHPSSKPATPGCVLSTMYHVLGIDHHHVFYDQAQRPLPILNEGEPIKELIG